MVKSVWGALVGGVFATTTALAALPAACKVGQDCLIDVEGSQCADGTKSFFQVTLRPKAKHLLIYLSGGGACWDKTTCEKGYASRLTRVEEYQNWNSGKGIFNATAKNNPFASDYNVVTVPYCTGDVHAGDREANYGTARAPYVIRHRGFQNVAKTLAKVKAMMPNPEKVVMLGCSAGGIGAYYHLANLAKTFPENHKYVISDAGTPFKPPYLYETNYKNIMDHWGVSATLPAPLEGKPVKDFGAVVHSNTVRYPDLQFGFISAYRDIVMTFFSMSVGSPSAQTAVKKIIVDVADNDIGRDAEFQKVFYTDSSRHCHTGEPLENMTSLDTDLGEWLTAMVTDDYDGWENVRPDLSRRVRAASPYQPKTIEELKQVHPF